MRSRACLLSWALLVPVAQCFQAAIWLNGCTSCRVRLFAEMSPEEARALAMSNYLAKAHQDKLRAIKDIEDKKNAEIQSLKRELSELKNGGASKVAAQGAAPSASLAGVSTDLLTLSKEELAIKLLEYQNFMAKYIVDAHEQKVHAVEEANKKWQEKLLLLNQAVGSNPNIQLVVPSDATKLFDARNAVVVAAAAAGKSRWGNLEIERAATDVHVNGAPGTLTTAPSVEARSLQAAIPVPPQVQAADHGLRADGGVGGPTLAERVALGANLGARAVAALSSNVGARAVSTVSASGFSTNNSLYQKRNNMVLAAANMGKSRWGAQEIDRVEKYARLRLHSTQPATSAASHRGRLNVGARLLGH